MSLKTIHRTVGLGLCLILLLISITGVMLIWKKEYLWLTISQARAPVDRGLIAPAIIKIETLYPYEEVRLIQLYSEGLAMHKVFLKDYRYAWHDQRGERIESWQGNDRFEDWLLDLHHRFLLGNTIGLNTAGFSGLLLMPLLVTGFLLWWPRRRTLALGLWPRKPDRRSLMLSHGNIGSSFFLPVFLLALSGVILVYPVESRFVLVDGFGASKPPILSKTRLHPAPSSWDAVISQSNNRFPGSQLRWIVPASKKSPVLTVGLQQSGALSRTGKTSLKFSPNGDVITSDSFAQPLPKRVLDLSYPLHAGKFDLWYRVLLSLFGLALAMLCILGLMSFLQRRQLPK